MRLRKTLPAVAAAVALVMGASFISKPALAWECQEDVDDLRKKIKDDDNKDRWSKKQRQDALEHLRRAELKRINPLECREEVLKARKELGLGDILD